jgi:hypothetical protein
LNEEEEEGKKKKEERKKRKKKRKKEREEGEKKRKEEKRRRGRKNKIKIPLLLPYLLQQLPICPETHPKYLLQSHKPSSLPCPPLRIAHPTIPAQALGKARTNRIQLYVNAHRQNSFITNNYALEPVVKQMTSPFHNAVVALREALVEFLHEEGKVGELLLPVGGRAAENYPLGVEKKGSSDGFLLAEAVLALGLYKEVKVVS